MALKVRPAAKADIPHVVALVKAMSDESPRYNKYPFSVEKTTHLVTFFCNENLLTDTGGYVAEIDGELIGMIAGFVVDSLTHDFKMATDVGVYVKPEHRGGSAALRLIRTWEEWAFKMGADEINLGISTEVQADQTVHVYERLGFRMSTYCMVKDKI